MVASIYGPASVPLWEELWVDILEVGEAFRGVPLLFGGDFNITLEATDRPNDFGGRDPISEEFLPCMAAGGLQEMGLSDCVHTWHNSAHPHLLSRLDKFLRSSELLTEVS